MPKDTCVKLFFLRHAEAEVGADDAKRALTDKGRRHARKVGRYFKALGVKFDRAFSSPLVRAVQTAELVIKECPPRRGKGLVQRKELLNETSPAAFGKWLASFPAKSSILLVGHEPSMSAHVRRLLGVSAALALPLPKAAVARVDLEEGRQGVLRFLVGPKQIP